MQLFVTVLCRLPPHPPHHHHHHPPLQLPYPLHQRRESKGKSHRCASWRACHLRLVHVSDSPVCLFIDRWVTGECLGPHISQQPRAGFITSCHLRHAAPLIQPPSHPDARFLRNKKINGKRKTGMEGTFRLNLKRCQTPNLARSATTFNLRGSTTSRAEPNAPVFTCSTNATNPWMLRCYIVTSIKTTSSLEDVRVRYVHMYIISPWKKGTFENLNQKKAFKKNPKNLESQSWFFKRGHFCIVFRLSGLSSSRFSFEKKLNRQKKIKIRLTIPLAAKKKCVTRQRLKVEPPNIVYKICYENNILFWSEWTDYVKPIRSNFIWMCKCAFVFFKTVPPSDATFLKWLDWQFCSASWLFSAKTSGWQVNKKQNNPRTFEQKNILLCVIIMCVSEILK